MFFEPIHSIRNDEFQVSTGAAMNFPMHLHRSFELFVQNAGETTVEVNGTAYRLRAGEAVLIFPFQIHSYRCITAGRYEILIFSPDMVMDFYTRTQQLLPVSNKMRCESVALGEPDNLYLKKACAYRICGLFERDRTYTQAADSGRHAVLTQLLLYANERFQTKCLLADVCKEIGYDYTYISKYFKKAVGLPFRRYVNVLRVRESQHLLESTDKAITEIAQACGFCSLRDFERTFGAIVGCTPTGYRNRPGHPSAG